MVTMQEVRQKFPQYDDMSDEDLAGALHKKFYSDMPIEDFQTKIGLKVAPVAKQPVDDGPGFKEAMDLANTVLESATPTGMATKVGRYAGNYLAENGADIAKGVIDSGIQAVTAPARALTGELRMTDDAGRTSPEAISEAANMAMLATPSSVASLPKAVATKAVEKAVVAPVLKEGDKVAQAARNIDVTLPRAVTSDSQVVNQIGKNAASIPVVGQPLRKASQTAIDQMDTVAKKVQDDLGTGNKEVAGNKIKQDLADFAKKVEPEKVTELYTKVDELVDPKARIPLSATQRIANNISTRRSAAKLESSSAVDYVTKALQSKEGMSYQEIKDLRTAVGELMKNKSELAARKIADSEIDQIYRGLSIDLEKAVKAGGGDEAVTAFKEANSRAKIFARDKEALKKVLGEGSDESATTKLLALAGKTSKANLRDLRLAKSKVTPDTWNELASSSLETMGRDAAGNFTPDRFVTSWGKMSDSGKKILFSPEHRQALEDLATVSTRFKKLNQYANPSGTGQTVMTGALVLSPLATIKAAIPAFAASTYLAAPAKAKVVADYAKAYEAAVTRPGQVTHTNLARRARALAMIAANGNKQEASILANQLVTTQKTAAKQKDDEDPRREEGNPKAEKADEELNQAVLEGRAF